MRSTFWPNRIFDRQSSQNCHNGLEFLQKWENSTLTIKILQNGHFRSCVQALRFGQIAFLTVKVLKILTMAWISIQNAKTVRFFVKILQNALFRSVAARFGQIALLSVKVLKMVKLASNSLQNGKTVRFSLIVFKTLFSGHAEHVLAKSHFWASISQNRETGMKFF